MSGKTVNFSVQPVKLKALREVALRLGYASPTATDTGNVSAFIRALCEVAEQRPADLEAALRGLGLAKE